MEWYLKELIDKAQVTQKCDKQTCTDIQYKMYTVYKHCTKP